MAEGREQGVQDAGVLGSADGPKQHGEQLQHHHAEDKQQDVAQHIVDVDTKTEQGDGQGADGR
eukprot:NODE_6942_length_597_cov_2.531022_g5948_i0.p3 GENE.NODE_6942_length_597_cov_2.531022_g5948_i0~~NODE_6942_length_597_cov_2.531022_g5948_i0.p3  ORF type:complete len:63 (+),score=17.72 NODE_6942_length_597_cov_2.531022_g5948_i0:114-302(+)